MKRAAFSAADASNMWSIFHVVDRALRFGLVARDRRRPRLVELRVVRLAHRLELRRLGRRRGIAGRGLGHRRARSMKLDWIMAHLDIPAWWRKASASP